MISLPPDLRSRWERLLQQPLAPVEVLRGDLEDYLARVEGTQADPKVLEGLVVGCRALLAGEWDEERRRLVQAAVTYFLMEDDEEPDLDSVAGLDDDAEVFNAVARAVGRADLVIPLS